MNSQLLDDCRNSHKEKDWAEVIKIAETALNDSNLDSLTLVNIGIIVRDSHEFELSDRIFSNLLSKEPDFRFAYYEIAVSYMLQGRHQDCANILTDFLEQWPGDIRVIALQSKALYLVGAESEADTNIARVPTYENCIEDFALVKAFGDFLRKRPLGRTRTLMRSVLKQSPMLTVDEVKYKILSAKKDRRPFSIVRLGDGEGSFLPIDTLDELNNQILYADNRRQFLDYWFGKNVDQIQKKFFKTVSGLSSGISEADIVGLPLPSWVEHEYSIGSSRGISALTNVYRFMKKLQKEGNNIAFCSQSIHIDLGQSGLFNELFEGEKSIGLISCFSELPTYICKKFHIADVEFYKLPGEQYFKDIIGSGAAEGNHFPDIFDNVMAKLGEIKPGKIFLVAGGILGKFYVQQIKQSGSIALDIGSLADAWVNKPTRPGYEKLAGLAL